MRTTSFVIGLASIALGCSSGSREDLANGDAGGGVHEDGGSSVELVDASRELELDAELPEPDEAESTADAGARDASQASDSGGDKLDATADAAKPCPTSYVDDDGDGWGSEPVPACQESPKATARAGDCDDSDSRVNPDQAMWFAEPRANGSFDYDCNGVEEQQRTMIGKCPTAATMTPGSVGWLFLTGLGGVPDCGDEGTWKVNAAACNGITTTVQQQCR